MLGTNFSQEAFAIRAFHSAPLKKTMSSPNLKLFLSPDDNLLTFILKGHRLEWLRSSLWSRVEIFLLLLRF